MDTLTTPQPTVLTGPDVARLASVPLDSLSGVQHRVLWQDGWSMAGVLTIDAGERLGMHAHRINHHHIWVLEGTASICGSEVGPGSYVHVPAGVEHDLDATRTEGCRVFYLYLRPGE